jgi:hypothetical protein
MDFKYFLLALKLDPQNVQECSLDGCVRLRCFLNEYLFTKCLSHFTHCNDWTDLECFILMWTRKESFFLYSLLQSSHL